MTVEAVWGVILAAGRGSRFGSNKLLVPFRGDPLVTHAFRTASDAIASGLLRGAVVVCAENDQVVASLAYRAGLDIVKPSGGSMAMSLRAGFERLSSLAIPPDGALVMLGDQPLVGLNHLQALLASAGKSTAPICRPRYLATPDHLGHPVLVRRGAWHAMASVEGDQGLREVIAAGGLEVHSCDFTGSCPDVDTPEDLIALEAAH